MRTYPIATLAWKSLAFAGLTSVMLLHTGAPAAAKMMNSCQLRHSVCTERCIMKQSGGGEEYVAKVNACIGRTCDHQYKACAASIGDGRDPHDHGGAPGRGGGGRGRLTLPGSTPKVGPPAGGILESGTVLGSQGPAATGSPTGGGRPATPSAPPVIIR